MKKYNSYKEWIKSLKDTYIGKTVLFENNRYDIIDVDYNGFLLINKKSLHNNTTAISICKHKRNII